MRKSELGVCPLPDSGLRETILRPSALLGWKGSMDHAGAMRLQAAVKYVWGELRQAERDSFEEHYFDCSECALDVQAAAAFADNARNMFCHQAREVTLRAAAPAGGRWLARCKLIAGVPAFAVLLIVVLASAWQCFFQRMDSIKRASKLLGHNPDDG